MRAERIAVSAVSTKMAPTQGCRHGARHAVARREPRGATASFGAESVVTRMSQLIGEPIDISDLPKGRVLAALYNNAKPQGLGFIDASPGFMSENEAGALLAVATFFDYVHGRVMKVNLAGHAFHPWGYDRDNGAGLAAEVVGRLRRPGRPDRLFSMT